jgi:hypothetical protein
VNQVHSCGQSHTLARDFPPISKRRLDESSAWCSLVCGPQPERPGRRAVRELRRGVYAVVAACALDDDSSGYFTNEVEFSTRPREWAWEHFSGKIASGESLRTSACPPASECEGRRPSRTRSFASCRTAPSASSLNFLSHPLQHCLISCPLDVNRMGSPIFPTSSISKMKASFPRAWSSHRRPRRRTPCLRRRARDGGRRA